MKSACCDPLVITIKCFKKTCTEATNFCIMVCSHLKLLPSSLFLPSFLFTFSLFQKVSVAHHRMFYCYVPLVEDGYSVAYIPQDDQILFGVSSFHHGQHPDTGSKQYIQKLKDSMTEMHNIMVATGGLTSKL